MKYTIPHQEVDKMFAAHVAWVESYGKLETPLGARLVIHERVIADLNVSSLDLTSCEMLSCTITDSTFERCDFSRASLIDCIFQNCRFLECVFWKGDLRGSDFRSSSFAGCDFTRADLTEANLTHVSLADCVFRYAWFIRTDLRFAILERVDFKNAHFSFAKMYNNRRYRVSAIDDVIVEDADFTEAGDGSILMGNEVFAHLADLT